MIRLGGNSRTQTQHGKSIAANFWSNPMTLLTKLKAPFPVKKVKWRKGGGGTNLAYADARTYQERLDEVMGDGWQCRFPIVTEHGTVCEVGLLIDGEWRWRSNGAGATNIEGEKGQFTDAFKRACSMWGVGKYLYALPSDGTLPEWATPQGYAKLVLGRNGSKKQDD
jgi:hypothetical protein